MQMWTQYVYGKQPKLIKMSKYFEIMAYACEDSYTFKKIEIEIMNPMNENY